jgi:two-component system alkaline phosphatase synthesis response regulator PhoP
MKRTAILIADDDPQIVELVQAYLEKKGFAVMLAADGESALERVARERPDLVVLDIMLPKLDGWAVCRRLREDPDTRTIPIVMLTSRGEEMDRVLGLELGADDYVTKPFSPRELVARIKAAANHERVHEAHPARVDTPNRTRTDFIRASGRRYTFARAGIALPALPGTLRGTRAGEPSRAAGGHL